MQFLKVPIFLTIYQAILYFISKLFVFKPILLSSKIDNMIPFTSYFIYFYVLWYLMLFLLPYLYMKYDNKTLKVYIYTNFISVLICSIIFIIFPTTIIRPEIEITNLSTALVNFIYLMDTPSINCLPSIHCLICFIFIFCTLNSKIPPVIKIISNGLSILIIVSTMFIKQHVIYDALAAFIIVYVVYKIVLKKELKLSFLSFLHKKQ